MKFKIFLAGILAVSAVANFVFFFRPCLLVPGCELADDLFLLSASEEKRDFAADAAGSAKDRFQRSFAYKAVRGAIILDPELEVPWIVSLQSQWRMRFDPSGARMLSDVLEELGREDGSQYTLFEGQDIAMAEHGMTGELSGERLETATHEICHVLFWNFMDGRSFSDAIDEVAAVSCESDEFIDTRIARYKSITDRGLSVAWDDFLAMQHPIKAREDLMAMLRDGVAAARTGVKFQVGEETELGDEIDLFYSQSTAFAGYWQRRCPGRNVLGELARNLSDGTPFSTWLRTNEIGCGPPSLSDFEVELEQFLQQI